MRDAFEIDGVEHELWLSRGAAGAAGAAGAYALHAGDRVLPVSLTLGDDGAGELVVDGRRVPVVVVQRGDEVFVHVDGANWRLRHRDALARASAEAHAGADDEVRAPMPGTALSVAVRGGERVARGHPLLTMESMKLETTIVAPRDATVRSVTVAAGQAFERDALLVTFEPPEDA